MGRFYNDIIFPGSRVTAGPHFYCQSVQVVGQLQLTKVQDNDQREQSRQHRIQDIKAIQRILKVPDREQRACLIVNLLCRRLGLSAARTLSPNVVAQLVFANPAQVYEAYRSYEKSLSGLAISGRLGDAAALAWQRRQYQDAP